MKGSGKVSGLWRAAAAVSGPLAVPAAVLACPLCKDAISGDPVSTALSWTTLVMIAVPFVLLVSSGSWLGYMYWRAAHPKTSQRPRPLNWSSIWTEKESET